MSLKSSIITIPLFAFSSLISCPPQLTGQILATNSQVHATTAPLDNIRVGDHISLGNQQFIKLNNNGLLMMSSTFTCPHGKVIAGKHVKCFDCPSDAIYDSTNVSCTCSDSNQTFDWKTQTCKFAGLPADADTTNCNNPIALMDSWTGCDSLQEFDTVCLADSRDYRTYNVRKFADGQCWMVDSLKFGGNYGDTDGCAANNGEGNFTYAWCGGQETEGCTAGGSSDATKAQETFSTGYYGHCRYIGTVDNTLYNNYLYDWVAAMQNTLAYSGSTTDFEGAQQGICPAGWHLLHETGKNSGEMYDLASLHGANSLPKTDSSPFWTDVSQWNGQLSGVARNEDGTLAYQGTYGIYWTSNGYSSDASKGGSYGLTTDSAMFTAISGKAYGIAVRCVQD
ncbi:hypothetical protein IJJ27_03150 [bacterium]|nr:hypothetical protein [bacterium]